MYNNNRGAEKNSNKWKFFIPTLGTKITKISHEKKTPPVPTVRLKGGAIEFGAWTAPKEKKNVYTANVKIVQKPPRFYL